MTRRVTVQDAAPILGLSVDAIRKRVERGTIEHEKDPDTGRVWITLDDRQAASSTSTGRQHDRHDRHDTLQGELVEELRDRVRSLERQLDAERNAHRETRQIAAMLAQRVPELEAASEATQPQDAQGDTPEGSSTPAPETPSSRPSWWRRFFGW